MPAEVTFMLVIPPELGTADAVIAEGQAGVEEVERAMREHRARTGARIVGFFPRRYPCAPVHGEGFWPMLDLGDDRSPP